MPRLRVLSMRNNQLRTIKERTFRNLRGNIAILDVDGMCISISRHFRKKIIFIAKLQATP